MVIAGVYFLRMCGSPYPLFPKRNIGVGALACLEIASEGLTSWQHHEGDEEQSCLFLGPHIGYYFVINLKK